jgi:hypothetical protein
MVTSPLPTGHSARGPHQFRHARLLSKREFSQVFEDNQFRRYRNREGVDAVLSASFVVDPEPTVPGPALVPNSLMYVRKQAGVIVAKKCYRSGVLTSAPAPQTHVREISTAQTSAAGIVDIILLFRHPAQFSF